MQCQNNIGCCGQFVAQTHQHTHAADPEGNDLLKARAGIKRSAKDTAEKTQNIITANIAGLQENVLARLPTVPDINDTQLAIPQNYTVEVLGQQFLVYDNGRPD